MLPLLGNALLIILIVVAGLISVPNIFMRPKYSMSNKFVKIGFFACNALVVLMLVLLEYAFISTNLSFKIVYLNSHKIKPLIFKIAGVWANHEGSMLLWLLVLCLSGLIYLPLSRSSVLLKSLVLSVQALSIAIFALYIYFTSNPFEHNMLVPAQGLGLNPILQDRGLLFHPPSLYLGYVGFSITYAITLALMLLNSPSFLKAAIRDMRLWCLFSWVVLTFGILMGSLWSYRELGWGGYWFWDPVENASLIPWLIANALIHNLFLFERRKIMFGWIVSCSIFTYAASILGTFVVRSGILNSVHTFASAPERGVLLLAIAAFIVVLGFAAYCRFGGIVKGKALAKQEFSLLSKECFLLCNNIIMLCAACIILFATLYPIIAELMFHVKLSIGAQYYNTVLMPIAFAVLILSFLANNVQWTHDTLKNLRCRLQYEIIAFVLCLYLYVILAFSVALSSSIIVVFVVNLYRKFRQANYSYNVLFVDIAHFGFALLVFAVIANSTYEREISYKLEIGEQVEFDGKLATLEDIRFFQKDNFLVRQGVISFGNYKAYPENRVYIAEQSTAQESYIIKNFFSDYYFSIHSTDGMNQEEIILNITLKSYINLIWIASYVIIFATCSRMLLYIFRDRSR